MLSSLFYTLSRKRIYHDKNNMLFVICFSEKKLDIL